MARALEGMKIIDLSMNLPGPYMTWLLADLGAEVVKIESPGSGDSARALGSTGEGSPFFAAVNRNKKSVTLNLKHPDGKKIFLGLLDTHDIIVEGFRPGTMERLGLGYETTSARNPRLIHVSISGYGQNGPYRLRAGHDLSYLSLAGIIGMTGAREGEPAIPGIQVADLAGGSLLALAGLLAAVIQRQITGKGQFVDTSMFHGALSLATMVFGGVDAGLEQARPGRMFLNGRFPCYGLYRTADGRHMSLGALESKFWQSFCTACNRPDLMSGQFGGPEVRAELDALFASRTQQEWISLMRDHDACCEPVLSLEEAVESPLVHERGMTLARTDGRRFLSSPFRLSDSPGCEDGPAPALGEHTREVLTQAGLTEEQCTALAVEGVI